MPQYAIVESSRRLPKGQRHEKREKVDHRQQSEKWDEYKYVYHCEGQWECEDHWEGSGERHLGIASSQWRKGIAVLYPDQRRYMEQRRREENERREGVEKRELKGEDH